jgi:hypothetical protein
MNSKQRQFGLVQQRRLFVLRPFVIRLVTLSFLGLGLLGVLCTPATAAAQPTQKQVLQQLMRNTDVPLSATKDCVSVSPPGSTRIGDYLASVLGNLAEASSPPVSPTSVKVEVTRGTPRKGRPTWSADVKFRIDDDESPYDAGVRFLLTDNGTMYRSTIQCIGVN